MEVGPCPARIADFRRLGSEAQFAGGQLFDRDGLQAFATTGAGNAETVGETETGAVGGADQVLLVDQELARRITETTALVGADIAPSAEPGWQTFDDDRLNFAGDKRRNLHDAAVGQILPVD